MPELPVARAEGLIIEEVSDEVLVYDEETDKAHCLNHTAALIWKHCDGQKSAAEIAARLEAQLKLPVSEQVVNLGLQELSTRKLLVNDSLVSEFNSKLSRRRLVTSMGLTAMVALPLIMSIVAPTAAQAGSAACNQPTGRPLGCPCTNDNECAEFNCNQGVCGPQL